MNKQVDKILDIFEDNEVNGDWDWRGWRKDMTDAGFTQKQIQQIEDHNHPPYIRDDGAIVYESLWEREMENILK